jgi:transcriptional regulator with XRE-family HTH domain
MATPQAATGQRTLLWRRPGPYNRRMMDEPANLCAKIARLALERGWNQDEFARNAGLNRLTIRTILQGPERRLHNATVSACARALGLSVNDLHTVSLDRLLPRMHAAAPAQVNPRQLYEQAMQPELLAWIESHREEAARLKADELDELLSLQGTGGPLTAEGVSLWVERIERKRRLLEQAAVIAGTEYIDLLEQLLGLLYEKIQPYRDRGGG